MVAQVAVLDGFWSTRDKEGKTHSNMYAKVSISKLYISEISIDLPEGGQHSVHIQCLVLVLTRAKQDVVVLATSFPSQLSSAMHPTSTLPVVAHVTLNPH